MERPYVSSIVTKYGDLGQVKADAKTVNEIVARQGLALLIDLIAEKVGEKANLEKCTNEERSELRQMIVSELNESILERI